MSTAPAVVPRGYKQTEIGVFPEDWAIKTLGEIGEVTGAGVDKKSNPGEEPVRLVNYVDVYNRRPITSNLLSHWVTAPANKANRCSVRKGDVFFTPTSEVREDIAVSSMALEDIPDAVYSYHLVRLRCNDEVEVAYRAHAFSAKYFLDQASVLADGSGTRYVVNLPNFRRMLVALPPRDEQRRIGTLLTDVETQIATLKELITKKTNIKQGTMQELLTGKTRLPGFSGTWELKTLFELAENKKSLFDDGDWIEAEHISESGIRLIQTGNIGIGCFLDKNSKKYIRNESFERLKCKEIFPGDLLVCRLAEPSGRACVLPEISENRIITSVDVTIYRPPKNLACRVFLQYIFSTSDWLDLVSNNSGGTTHKRISRSVLGKLKIKIPEINEQEAIAEVLSDMDAEIAALEERLEKVKAIKQGMIQQLLTGKIRLVD